MFRSAKVSRVLLNLGGIANLTAIPAGAGLDEVMAFDTGPGNMVIDACMARLFGTGVRSRWGGGAAGRVLHECGGGGFAGGVLLCPAAEVVWAGGVWGGVCRAVYCDVPEGGGESDADVVATATALTAASVVDAYRRFVWGHVGQAAPLS